MTATKIDLSFNKIPRLQDAADLAELMFPGNRNQQHAFLLVWFSLKWAGHGLVPNFEGIAREHGVSRRTLERVRAKLRRLGLIDHVSRFNARHGYREGWVLSSRCENSLHRLAEKVAALRSVEDGSCEKDELLVKLAEARRDASGRRAKPIIGATIDATTRRTEP
jgi:hypothetical protein